MANGVTRRDFLLGAGAFGLVTAVLFAALVPIGRGVEWLLRTAFGVAANGYPDFSAGEAVRDFGHYAPGAIGWLVTGALVAAGFYRYSWWAGLLLIIPFALPLAVPEIVARPLRGARHREAPIRPVRRRSWRSRCWPAPPEPSSCG